MLHLSRTTYFVTFSFPLKFSVSISKGIIWGLISYVICKVAGKKAKEIPVVTWILAAVFIADVIFEAIK